MLPDGKMREGLFEEQTERKEEDAKEDRDFIKKFVCIWWTENNILETVYTCSCYNLAEFFSRLVASSIFFRSDNRRASVATFVPHCIKKKLFIFSHTSFLSIALSLKRIELHGSRRLIGRVRKKEIAWRGAYLFFTRAQKQPFLSLSLSLSLSLFLCLVACDVSIAELRALAVQHGEWAW